MKKYRKSARYAKDGVEFSSCIVCNMMSKSLEDINIPFNHTGELLNETKNDKL